MKSKKNPKQVELHKVSGKDLLSAIERAASQRKQGLAQHMKSSVAATLIESVKKDS